MTTLLDPTASVIAVSGNPRPRSRTLTAAQTVADQIAGRLALERSADLDLADVAGQLFSADAPEADRYRSTLAAAAVAVVATPVYKASFTGLLKAFLDRYPGGGLRGVVAVPLVVSASPAHSFVGEHALRPLLVELGAVVATPAIAVTEAQLGDLDGVVAAWLTDSAAVLSRLVRVGSFEAVR